MSLDARTRERDQYTLVTGATAGIGRATAQALAGEGVAVGLVARDRPRGEAARAEMAEATGNERIRVFDGDLSSLASVRALASEVAATWPRVDAIVHCAAVYTRNRSVTTDGLETMFATNVLGPFLLTELLLPSLSDVDGRVIFLTAPSTVRLDFDDLQAERRFRSLSAFGATKAADLVLTSELARRTEGAGITIMAVHPGLVRTNLMRRAPALLRWPIRLVSRDPRRAAAALVPLVLSPVYAGRSGRFFKDAREIDAPAYTRDPAVGRRLWEACSDLAGPIRTQGAMP